jgi:hypothetical protein
MLTPTWKAILSFLEQLSNVVSLRLDLTSIEVGDVPFCQKSLQLFFEKSAQNLKELGILIPMEKLDILDFEAPFIPHLGTVHLRLGRYERMEDGTAMVAETKIKKMNKFLTPFLERQKATIRHLHLNFNYNKVADVKGILRAIESLDGLHSLSMDGYWSIGREVGVRWFVADFSERDLQGVLIKHQATLEHLNLSPFNRAVWHDTTVPLALDHSISTGFPFVNTLKLGGVVEFSNSFFVFLRTRLGQLKTLWINNTILRGEDLEQLVAIMKEWKTKLRLGNLALCVPLEDIELLCSGLVIPSELEVLHIKLVEVNDYGVSPYVFPV